MSDRHLENEVIRRWQDGTPMRRIAAELRISRHPVKQLILEHQKGRAEGTIHPDLPTPPESRGSILDAHLPFIQDLLVRWPCITALRVFEELRGDILVAVLADFPGFHVASPGFDSEDS